MKRLIGLILCAVLILSTVPVAARALDTSSRYCRNALAELPNGAALQYAYDTILDGFLDFEEEITLDEDRALAYDDIVTVASALRGDCPETFWQSEGFSVSLKSNGVVVGITTSYIYTAKEAEEMTRQMSDAADEIVSLVKSTDAAGIALELHDIIARRVTYIDGDDAHNAYGALVRGKAVCDGYAYAYQYLLRRFGIESIVVIGGSRNELHAWNIVCLDGKWTHIDATWDDTGDRLFHRYFAISDDVITGDHTVEPTAYPLPKCTSEDHTYFKKGYNYFDTFDVDALADLLRENLEEGAAYAEFLVDDEEAFGAWLSTHASDIIDALGLTGHITYQTLALDGEVHLAFGTHVHDIVGVMGKEPTCTEDGYMACYLCTECSSLFVDMECAYMIDDLSEWRATYGKLKSFGHQWDDGTVLKDSTEKETGVIRYACTECTETRDEEIPLKPHVHTAGDAATCTTPQVCTGCGDELSPMLGHDFSTEWTIDREAAPGVAGEMSRHCSRCTERCDIIEIPALPVPVDSTKMFTDVKKSSWFREAVDFAVTNGLMNGVGEGTFDPNGTMTRAMLVTVLWRLEGEPTSSVKVPFTDLKQSWYRDAVAWAYENEIVNGTSEGKFSPNGAITREQLAAILYRFSDYKHQDVSARGSLGGFPDASSVHSYATDPVSWAVAEELIGGVAKGGKTYLDPRGSATRAQVATILQRYCGKL